MKNRKLIHQLDAELQGTTGRLVSFALLLITDPQLGHLVIQLFGELSFLNVP